MASASNRFSLVFSSSSDLSRLASETSRPPYFAFHLYVLDRVRDLQPVGQRDPRDFDNLVWTLPIPEYDAAEVLHTDLAAAALHAATVASCVELSDAAHFTSKRRAIRQALAEDGVAETIERLVDALLPL